MNRIELPMTKWTEALVKDLNDELSIFGMDRIHPLGVRATQQRRVGDLVHIERRKNEIYQIVSIIPLSVFGPSIKTITRKISHILSEKVRFQRDTVWEARFESIAFLEKQNNECN